MPWPFSLCGGTILSASILCLMRPRYDDAIN
nr:MAG TPA: hypothetical protein [Caudoviricetes sp.]